MTTYRVDYTDIDSLPMPLYRSIMGAIRQCSVSYASGDDAIVFSIHEPVANDAAVAFFASKRVPLHIIRDTLPAQQQAARDALVAHQAAMPVQPTFRCSSDAIVAYAVALQAWVERNRELEAACMATV